jgi:hypothetical protein
MNNEPLTKADLAIAISEVKAELHKTLLTAAFWMIGIQSSSARGTAGSARSAGVFSSQRTWSIFTPR